MKDVPTDKNDASATEAVETLAVGDRSEAWTRLTDLVRAFGEAWSRLDAPPPLVEYLPAEPAGLRHLTLNELIKVDLRQRWQRNQGKSIEQYLAEYPELAHSGELPCDVILEEYQVRQQVGEALDIETFVARFPQQADSLRRLINEAPRTISTAIVPSEKSATLEAGERIDDFELIVRLGQGAFASVFLARQISMQRMVALKVSADRGQEPQTLAQLDHPHIVRVFDQRSVPSKRCRLLYMQYISGGTLLEVVQHLHRIPVNERSGRMLLEAIDQSLLARGESAPTDSNLRRFLSEASWSEAVCWLGARLAEALDYAHQRGVLHRDIKPANVLLSPDGSPKLADFNISYCSKLDGATAAAYMGGSLAYMSPEQLEACDPNHPRAIDELDGRSDLYSLGVMLFELLAGQRPFPDLSMNRSWNATLKAYAEQRRQGLPAEAWRLLPADCPRHLVDSLRVCLSANRDDRPATAGQFARQLQLCLQPRVQSLLKPRTQSWQSWARQHPFAAICATGLIPNGICSALNIIYNFREIVSHLKAIDALPVFYRQVAIINPVAFILGTFLVIRFAWPVIAALTQAKSHTLAESYELQKRTLKLGDRVAWVSGIEWIASGFIFPIWLHIEVGEAAGLTLNHYVHFLVSQIICGLLAATQSFFLLTTLSVHVLFAGLVRADQDSPEPLAWLRALLARVGWMYHLAMSLPFLAISAFVLADVRESAPFLVMAGLGFGSFAISYRLFGVIQSDIETLAVAVSPAQDMSTSTINGSTSSRSFRRGP